jgi:DNA polymerase III alpha subunit
MKNNITPIFTSHFSFGKSTLTLEKPEEIVDNKPISIFSIAKKYELKEIFLIENNFSGFIEAYKTAKDNDVLLRFGLKIVVCSSIENKSEESFRTESKVIIWMNNSEAYKDLIKIYSNASTDGFYYIPRIDWKTLNSMWSKNLSLSIPCYSSFLHKNLLEYGECVPDFTKVKPNIFFSQMGLPFDDMIYESHKNYSKNNNLELNECHPVYFYSDKQKDSYLVYKAIHNRSNLSMPGLSHFSSTGFNWESYLQKIN